MKWTDITAAGWYTMTRGTSDRGVIVEITSPAGPDLHREVIYPNGYGFRLAASGDAACYVPTRISMDGWELVESPQFRQPIYRLPATGELRSFAGLPRHVRKFLESETEQ